MSGWGDEERVRQAGGGCLFSTFVGRQTHEIFLYDRQDDVAPEVFFVCELMGRGQNAVGCGEETPLGGGTAHSSPVKEGTPVFCVQPLRIAFSSDPHGHFVRQPGIRLRAD